MENNMENNSGSILNFFKKMHIAIFIGWSFSVIIIIWQASSVISVYNYIQGWHSVRRSHSATFINNLDIIEMQILSLVPLHYTGTDVPIHNIINQVTFFYNNARHALESSNHYNLNSTMIPADELAIRLQLIQNLNNGLNMLHEKLFVNISQNFDFGNLSVNSDPLFEVQEIVNYIQSQVDIIFAISEQFNDTLNDKVLRQFQNIFIKVIIFGLAFIILLFLLNRYLYVLVLKPLSKVTKVLKEISIGNLDVEIPTYRNDEDEIGILIKSSKNLKEDLENLIQEIKSLKEEVVLKGNIDYRLSEEAYEDTYRELIVSLNDYGESFVLDIMEILNFVSSIEEGNFNFEVEEFSGKKIILTTCLRSLMENLRGISQEIENLSKGVKTHTDTEKYLGEWKNMMLHLNDIMDARNLLEGGAHGK